MTRWTRSRLPIYIYIYIIICELACYKQVLASVLQLTIRTTPVPYLVNAQSVATVRCVVTHGKD